MSFTRWPRQQWAPALAVGLAALATIFLANGLWMKVLTSVAIFTLTAMSVALLYRRLGQISLGHVALMGLGGWVALRFSHGFSLPFELNLLAGGVVAGLVGVALAYPALRMRGLYLSLVTLMAAGGFSIVVNNTQFPNGADGFLGFAVRATAYMPRPVLAQSDAAYFIYCLVVTGLGFLLVHLHEAGKPGRAWALIRRSEATAMAAGVNVTLYKVWGFALSGFLAGAAGALLAGSLQLLDAHSFPPADSVMICALTIVGGAWNWFGALIAALLFRLAPALLNDWGLNGNAAYIFFGLALIHALATAPRGVAGKLEEALAAGNRK